MDSENPSRSLSRRGFVGVTAGIGAAGLLGGQMVEPANASAAAFTKAGGRTRVETIQLGKVTVTRVVEFSGPVGSIAGVGNLCSANCGRRTRTG